MTSTQDNIIISCCFIAGVSIFMAAPFLYEKLKSYTILKINKVTFNEEVYYNDDFEPLWDRTEMAINLKTNLNTGAYNLPDGVFCTNFWDILISNIGIERKIYLFYHLFVHYHPAIHRLEVAKINEYFINTEDIMYDELSVNMKNMLIKILDITTQLLNF